MSVPARRPCLALHALRQDLLQREHVFPHLLRLREELPQDIPAEHTSQLVQWWMVDKWLSGKIDVWAYG